MSVKKSLLVLMILGIMTPLIAMGEGGVGEADGCPQQSTNPCACINGGTGAAPAGGTTTTTPTSTTGEE